MPHTKDLYGFFDFSNRTRIHLNPMGNRRPNDVIVDSRDTIGHLWYKTGLTGGQTQPLRARRRFPWLGIGRARPRPHKFSMLPFPLAFSLMLLSLLAVASPVFAKEVKIGVRADMGDEQAVARWQATADTLGEKINGYTFTVVPYGSPDAIVNGALKKEFGFVIADPSAYVRMEVTAGADKMFSLVNNWNGSPLIRFGSVVFTRKTQANLRNLEDLRGKRLMAVSPHAFGGWQLVLAEFRERNIDPTVFLGALTFSGGNQPAVVNAVRDGKVDAGVVRTGVLENMAADGQINIEDFRIIEPRQVAGFPFQVSTGLYPEWVFAKLPGVSAKLESQVRQVLQDIWPDSRAAETGKYVGWQYPLNYRPVHNLLQNLGVAPYEHDARRDLIKLIWNNRYWLAVLFFSVAGLFIALYSAVRRRVELSEARREIISHQQRELNFRQHALDEHAIVSITDRQGTIISASKKFVEISGYSEKELLGADHRILNSDAHDPEFFREMWQTIYRGKTWTGEIKNKRKDGTFYWVQSTIVPKLDKNGRPKKFISIRTDITAAKTQQARSHLTEYFELVKDEIYMFSCETLNCFFANRRARDVSGLSLDRAAGHSAIHVVLGADETTLREDLQALVDGRQDRLCFEVNRTTADGRSVVSEIHLQYLKSEWIEPCFFATGIDISARRAVEDEVVELKATLDRIDDEIFMFWPETKKFFYANQAAKDHLGLSEEAIFQMSPSDLAVGLSAKEFNSVLQMMIDEKTNVYSFVKKIGGRDGIDRSIEIEIEYVCPEGRKPRFMMDLRDVTERASAQERLRQLSSSLDLIKNEVYIFWPDSYEFMYLNRLALSRTGWTEKGWRGKRTIDFISEAEQAKLEKKCASLIKGPRKSAVFETVDRHGVPLEIYIHLIEPEGEKPRFLSVYRDITERKKSEKAKAEFISTVSHELRTPLTSIKASLGILRAGVVSGKPAETQRMLEIAYSNTERLTALVNDILDWEKIDGGKMTYQMKEVELSALMREAIEANRAYGEGYGVTLVIKEPLEKMYCKADRGRLMQVMANLISNAAKFSHAGSTVELSAQKTSNNLRVSVRDFGVGIPKEARDKVFERFTQVDSSDVRKNGGTGLGLSITRAIVEAHGGALDFVSEKGKGTTFSFDLPELRVEADEEIPTSGLPQSAGGRILIIEDDPDVATVLRSMLEHDGFFVKIARTARQAKELLATDVFDGITLDLGLPDQDGISLLQELRSNKATGHLPIVVVSANAENGKSSLSGDAFGVVDWLQKPIDEDRLIARLKDAVRQRSDGIQKILLVSQDTRLGTSVEAAVAQPCRITRSKTLAGAKDLLETKQFDLVLLDMALQDGNGEELLPLLNKGPQTATPVVVFSGQDESAERPERLKHALKKTNLPGDQLIQTIETALRFSIYSGTNPKRTPTDASTQENHACRR